MTLAKVTRSPGGTIVLKMRARAPGAPQSAVGQKKRKRNRKMEVMYICFWCWQLTQTEGISGLFNPILFFIAVFKIASILSRSTSTLKLNRLLDWHSQNVLFIDCKFLFSETKRQQRLQIQHSTPPILQNKNIFPSFYSRVARPV